MYKKRFYTLAKCINSNSYTYFGKITSSITGQIAELALSALPNEKRSIVLEDFTTSLDSYNIVSKTIIRQA